MSLTPTRTSEAESRLHNQIVCPHCWERYAPDEIVWVAEHVELYGDPKLGPEHPRRFLPSRFTPDGDAIDAKGRVCHELACPRCHLTLPRSVLDHEPLFFSVLGTPGSGKSYFLTSATWKLREILPHRFAVAFADADPVINQTLVSAEETLFLNPEPDKLAWLGGLIEKTDAAGNRLYNSVSYGTHAVSYLRPYVFMLRPMHHHPAAAARGPVRGRALCLYDNAGEHFLPGQDTAASPVTRHLALSRAILFLYDPTQDPRFREACQRAGLQPPKSERDRLYRQETTLNEAAARVKKHAGLAGGAKNDRLLVVVVTKFDTWSPLLGADDDGSPWRTPPAGRVAGFDAERVETLSAMLRRLLFGLCPEIVGAAEGFARNVVYLPVTALGDATEVDPATKLLAIRPRNVAPFGVAVPFLYALHRTTPGLIPKLRRTRTD